MLWGYYKGFYIPRRKKSADSKGYCQKATELSFFLKGLSEHIREKEMCTEENLFNFFYLSEVKLQGGRGAKHERRVPLSEKTEISQLPLIMG